MDRGEFVPLVFDAEGIRLGCQENSLLCIQLAEIFDRSYQILGGNPRAPRIGPQPGVIVLFPASEEVTTLLSRVLGHERSTIITFDFTGDISALMEAGVKISMKQLIDCQLTYPDSRTDHITRTKVLGIAKTIAGMNRSIDPLVLPAQQQLERKLNQDFNAIWFVMAHDDLPRTVLMTESFLEYAADDLAFTALACCKIIRDGQFKQIRQRSQAKVRNFQDWIRNTGSVLGPPLIRNAAFFKQYGMERYTSEYSSADRENDLIKILATWVDATFLLNADRVCRRAVTQFDTAFHNRKIMAAERLLEPKIDIVRQRAALRT
jgi:hypothetical protein